MDLSYFGLTRDPFGRDPALDELCLPEEHRRILIALRGELLAVPTTIVVEGLPGSGATLLARVFAASVPRHANLAVLRGNEPVVRMLDRVREQLDPHAAPVVDVATGLGRLADRIAQLGRNGVPTVLVVEEAHLQSPEASESLIGLGAHAFLFGRLGAGVGLHARAIATHRIPRLAQEESIAYLVDRISAAGRRARDLFTLAALASIANASGGRLGRLEELAMACLAEAARRGMREIPVTLVDQVVAEAFALRSPGADADGPPLASPPTPVADAVLVDQLFVDASEEARVQVAPSADPALPEAAGLERADREATFPVVPNTGAATLSVRAEPADRAPVEEFLQESSGFARGRAWIAGSVFVSLGMALVLLGFRVWPEVSDADLFQALRSTAIADSAKRAVSVLVAETEPVPPIAAAFETPVPDAPDDSDVPDDLADVAPDPEPPSKDASSALADRAGSLESSTDPVGQATAYFVQVGAFRRTANAEAMLDRLIEFDEGAHLLLRGDIVFVLTGGLPDREHAVALERILRRHGFTTYLRNDLAYTRAPRT